MPCPARFWWFKRVILTILVVAVALVLLTWWWGHEADRRFRAFIDSAHAQGQPILPEYFDTPPVPDAQNAARTLEDAAAKLALSRAFISFERHKGESDPLIPEDVELLKSTVAANGVPLKLARLARGQTGADWGVRARTPVLTSLSTQHLNAQRSLAKFLLWAARYEHAVGNESEAIEILRDLYHQAEIDDRGSGSIINHLISIGVDGLLTSTIEQVAPDLNFDGAGAPAGVAQVRSLIADLLDDRATQQQAVRAWYGERMMELDTAAWAAHSGGMIGFRTPITLRAPIELDVLRATDSVSRAAIAAAELSWPAARAKIPDTESADDLSHLEELSTALSHLLRVSSWRVIENSFRDLTARRAAAIELAVRLYRLDHEGHYPNTLQALVPAYLPYVPVDPFAADGRPMSYRRGPTLPSVYSVGENGVDDGGTSLPHPLSGANSAWLTRWECDDIVFPLEPRPPATQPSTEAQQDK